MGKYREFVCMASLFKPIHSQQVFLQYNLNFSRSLSLSEKKVLYIIYREAGEVDQKYIFRILSL